MEPKMNFISILCSTLVPMIMGFIYYQPSLMGIKWMNANGFSKDNISRPKPTLYILALVCSFLLTMFLWAWTTGAGGLEKSQVVDPIDGHSFETFKHGVFHGCVFSLFVVLPIFTTMKIFEMRKWSWTFVNWGYWTITVILMCGILSAWR